MNIQIFAPSYRRPTGVFTQAYLPECRYVVAESEAEAYRDAGHDIWSVPDSAQGNLCRIRNYILDNAPSDTVLLLDDDIDHFGRWDLGKRTKLTTHGAMEMIEHGFSLAEQFGVRFWGLNLLPDKGAYREYTPFCLRGTIGGPFQAHLNNPLRYDENLPLKEDYDMSLQVLNKYRRTLRLNMFHYVAAQHTNRGGCATYRTIEREMEQFELLRKKWGSKIVKMDPGARAKAGGKKVRWDINPIVKVPIPGV